MDKVLYNDKTFDTQKAKVEKYSKSINLKIDKNIPISALDGDNIFLSQKK